MRNGYDAFLTKFNASGTRVYSTFLGGSGGDNYNVKAGGLAVDDQGRAYLTGDTYSIDFPIVGGYQAAFSGPSGYDAYLAVIDTTVSGVPGLVYSTYLGGSGAEIAYGIAYAGARQVVIVGETGILSAPNVAFPTKNAFDATFNGVRDAFVAKFDTSLTGNASLLFSTYLGGSDYEYANDVAVDTQGGSRGRRSTIDNTHFRREHGVERFDSSGVHHQDKPPARRSLLDDFGGAHGVAAPLAWPNAAGDTYAGATNMPDHPPPRHGFPIVNPFKGVYGGCSSDAFIARLGSGADLLLTDGSAGTGRPAAVTYTLTIAQLSSDPSLAVTLADPRRRADLRDLHPPRARLRRTGNTRR